MGRAYQAYQTTVRSLETSGRTVSWAFAHADAMEARREADRFLHDKLRPYLRKIDWSEADYADVMRRESQYRELSQHACRLINALLLRPAPDLDALMWKLEYFADQTRHGYGEPASPRVMAIVADDARRLTGWA